MKISRRYSTILFGALMSLAMSFTISLFLTIVNSGFVPDFFEKWIRGFAISFVVALPISLIVVPIAKKIAEKITSD